MEQNAASAANDFACANVGCNVIGRDLVRLCAGFLLQPQVPKAALVFARRQPHYTTRPWTTALAAMVMKAAA